MIGSVLVFGAGGCLGRAVVNEFYSHNWDVIPATRRVVDITNETNLKNFILTLSPDVVINCSGMTNVEECERDLKKALSVNADAQAQIAYSSLYTVYISTDYVFDGSQIIYNTTDKTNPVNYYGLSKQLGEFYTQQLNPNHLIVRTAWLFGDGGRSFGSKILGHLSNPNLKVIEDHFGCPTFVNHLARTIRYLVEKRVCGIQHIVNKGFTSWEYVVKFLSEKLSLNLDPKLISIKDMNFLATRPKSVLLNMTSLVKDKMPDWREAILEFINVNKTNNETKIRLFDLFQNSSIWSRQLDIYH